MVGEAQMRVLAFAGAHGNRQVASAFLKRIGSIEPRPDVFVSAGDLGPGCMVDIFQGLSCLDVPILYVRGNHPLHYPSSEIEKSQYEIQRLSGVRWLGREASEIRGWHFIGQDAWTDFTDDEHDPQRYHDLLTRTEGLKAESTILITHHAPLGIFDRGSSYPAHAYTDGKGNLHAGSLALRFFAERFRPRIHIFAHLHSDGCRHGTVGGVLHANVCHLERRTRDGRYGITGSFKIIDVEKLEVTTYQLGAASPVVCPGCGRTNYIAYKRCVNCARGFSDVVAAEDLP